MGAHGYDLHNRLERDVMIKERKNEDLDLKSVRFEILKVLLLCAREELQFAYMNANPWSNMPEDLIFLWQNEFPPKDDVLEKAFSEDEQDELMALQELLSFFLEKRDRGEVLKWVSFENKDFLDFQREAKRALLVFPDKEIETCYTVLKEKYGS